MAQMATVGQIQSHQPVMRPHDGLVSLQVCWATAQALDVDTPLLWVEAKGLESTRLAQKLDRVNMLVSAVVTGAGVALGVLVGHGRAKSIKDGARSDILGGDEEDGLALALDFLLLMYKLTYDIASTLQNPTMI